MEKLTAIALAVLAVCLAWASPVAAAPGSANAAADEPGPLRILLTNDDGFAAPGIRAVRDALVAAGHEVTIVAPATDQSGSSGKLTLAFGSTVQVGAAVTALEERIPAIAVSTEVDLAAGPGRTCPRKRGQDRAFGGRFGSVWASGRS